MMTFHLDRDDWYTDDGLEDWDSEIAQYKHDRIEQDCLGCTDCKWCEKEDGKCYCTADPYEPEVEEDGLCDKFDNYTDWDEEFHRERAERKWDMWERR